MYKDIIITHSSCHKADFIDVIFIGVTCLYLEGDVKDFYSHLCISPNTHQIQIRLFLINTNPSKVINK